MTKGITLLLAIFLLSIPILATAQSQTATLSGVVEDPEAAPIAYGNIVLYQALDSTMIKVEVTGEAGAFTITNIAPGDYWLDISYVGLPPFRSKAFKLAQGEHKTLGTIRMEAESAELEEVVVTASKPLVELKAGKMVFNVQESVNAVGNNALELLRKSPGVVVDNNENITMLGRPGVRIFIDGKPSPLRGTDLSAYLKSLQSTDIESIEIITNPGAKYEAEGNAGLEEEQSRVKSEN